jgi:hypothetical protein
VIRNPDRGEKSSSERFQVEFVGVRNAMAVHGSFNKVWKPVLVSASAILVVVALAGVFLLWHWPFSREAVLKDLEEASTSKVHMDAFHGTYFPRPGCELTHVTFQHNPKAGTLPLITIETVRIEGTLWGVFTRHLRRIRADGLHILIPSRDSGEQFEAPKRSTFVIDDFMADGATAEVESREPEARSLKLLFRTLVISNVGSKGRHHSGPSFRTPSCRAKSPAQVPLVRGIQMISVKLQFLEITYSNTRTSMSCPASPVCSLLPVNSPERLITLRFKG